MKIEMFENKNYTAFMFIAISFVTLLIFFSFVSIFDDSKNRVDEKRQLINIITGLAVLDDNNSSNNGQQGEIYSGKSYFIYYFILVVLVFLIVVLSFRYFLPYLKKYS